MKPAGVTPGSVEDQAAAQKFLEAERASRASAGAVAPAQPKRPAWPALPQRSRPKPPSSLLTIRKPISRRARVSLIALSFAIPLLVWVVLSATQAVSPTFLPSPARTFEALLEMAKSGQLADDTWASLQRILIGFGIAVAISVPIGIAIGTFEAARALFAPVMGMARYLPATAFIPLLMIWLGVEEGPKIAVLIIGTVFFNTLMVADAVQSVPSALINVSYTLGARRNEVLRKVIVPHSLPGIIDSIRINVAAAWNLVVVAELVAATLGLGKRIIAAQRFNQTDRIFAVLFVIGLLGVLTDALLRLLRNKIGRWAA